MSTILYRKVTVNLNRSAEEALTATNRTWDVHGKVLIAIPQPIDQEVEVTFFKLGVFIHGIESLQYEYKIRGLKPADIFSVCAVNEADPTLAKENPNCTHWKNAKGEWCGIEFNQKGNQSPHVKAGWLGTNVFWPDHIWFAGVPE